MGRIGYRIWVVAWMTVNLITWTLMSQMIEWPPQLDGISRRASLTVDSSTRASRPENLVSHILDLREKDIYSYPL